MSYKSFRLIENLTKPVIRPRPISHMNRHVICSNFYDLYLMELTRRSYIVGKIYFSGPGFMKSSFSYSHTVDKTPYSEYWSLI